MIRHGITFSIVLKESGTSVVVIARILLLRLPFRQKLDVGLVIIRYAIVSLLPQKLRSIVVVHLVLHFDLEVKVMNSTTVNYSMRHSFSQKLRSIVVVHQVLPFVLEVKVRK
jgi:hypothetical protein